jgi:hypothetical protein
MPGRTLRRGYGLAHTKLRKRLEPLIRSGRAVCARCGKRIAPQENWDLDHNDYDRSRYLGPSHRRCNRATNTARRKKAQPARALSFFD